MTDKNDNTMYQYLLEAIAKWIAPKPDDAKRVCNVCKKKIRKGWYEIHDGCFVHDYCIAAVLRRACMEHSSLITEAFHITWNERKTKN